MGIFSKIRDAIFGAKEEGKMGKGAIDPTKVAPGAAAAPAEMSDLDVEAILNAKSAEKGVPSNWRTSIVDLMKLLDMDSSLTERKELAQELGYTGALDGSAEMNIWLHKAVMRELAKNGGRVPAELTD